VLWGQKGYNSNNTDVFNTTLKLQDYPYKTVKHGKGNNNTTGPIELKWTECPRSLHYQETSWTRKANEAVPSADNALTENDIIYQC